MLKQKFILFSGDEEMNKAQKKRVAELKTAGEKPKDAYSMMRAESQDEKIYNHAVWTPDGYLEKRNGSASR
jgi:hypothetical protein